ARARFGEGSGAAGQEGGNRAEECREPVLVADRAGGARVSCRPLRGGGSPVQAEFAGRREARRRGAELALAVPGRASPRQVGGGAGVAEESGEVVGGVPPRRRGRQGSAPAQLAGGTGPAPRGGNADQAEEVVGLERARSRPLRFGPASRRKRRQDRGKTSG